MTRYLAAAALGAVVVACNSAKAQDAQPPAPAALPPAAAEAGAAAKEPVLPPVIVKSGEAPDKTAAKKPDTAPPAEAPAATAKPRQRTVKAVPAASPAPATGGAAAGGSDAEAAAAEAARAKAQAEAYTAPNATTATKTDTPIAQTPASVQVVTQQVLKDQQVITIDQALQNASGVTVNSGGGFSGGRPFASIVLRGFGTDVVLRDGTPIYSYAGDSSAFAQEFANVESVEILKGPAAILYGALEPGGVVNITTKQPQATPAYSIEQQLGSFGLSRTTFNATGPLSTNKDVLYRLDLSYLNQGSQFQDGFTKNAFIAPVVQWRIDQANTVKLEFNYRNLKYNQNLGYLPTLNGALVNTNPAVNYGGRSPDEETTYFAALTHQHKFNADWAIKSRFVFNRTSQDLAGVTPLFIFDTGFPNGTTPLVGRELFPISAVNQSYNVTSDLTGHFNAFGIGHTLLAGGDYNRFESSSVGLMAAGSLNQNDPLGFPLGSVSYVDLFNPSKNGTPFSNLAPFDTTTQLTETAGFYLQDQIKLPYEFYLLAGFRYQYIHETGDTSIPSFGFNQVAGLTADAVTPRVGLLWQPLPWLSSYGSYSENFGPVSPGSIQFNGNIVPPSAGTQEEVGIKTSFYDGKLTASAAYFDLTKTNIPAADLLHPNQGFVSVIGAARARGFEFDAQGEVLPGLKIITNFAHTDARVTAASLGDNAPVGSRFGGVPFNVYRLFTTYDFQTQELKGLKIGGGLSFTDTQPFIPANGPTTQTLPGYTLFNLLAAYKFENFGDKWTAQINANNIFDRIYFTEAQTNPGNFNQPSAFSAFSGVYGQRRTIIGSLKVEF